MASNPYDYTALFQEMLAQVPNDIDKREGSVIYNTLTPTAYFITRQNYLLVYLFSQLYANMAVGSWLDRAVGDFGLIRRPATKAIRQIDTFDSADSPMSVPIGSRFAINDVAFILTEAIAIGQYKAQCEQPGINGNLYSGAILPIDNINNLGSAALAAQPLIMADDEESDDELRARFYLTMQKPAFGGNIADYEQKVLSLDGVGAVKVFAAADMGAGNVGLVIGDEDGRSAAPALVDTVQELMGTDGDGLSPIGHNVTVGTSVNLAVNVAASVSLKPGTSFLVVKPYVEEAITSYINSIGFNDASIYYAKLVAAILTSHSSILDVGSVTLNGSASNIQLSKTFNSYQVPVVGTVAVTEVA